MLGNFTMDKKIPDDKDVLLQSDPDNTTARAREQGGSFTENCK